MARKRGSHLEQGAVGRAAAVRANKPEDRTQLMPRITAANVPADAHDNRPKPQAATAGIVRISGKVRLSPGVLDNFAMINFLQPAN
jgi:hypothetical protein